MLDFKSKKKNKEIYHQKLKEIQHPPNVSYIILFQISSIFVSYFVRWTSASTSNDLEHADDGVSTIVEERTTMLGFSSFLIGVKSVTFAIYLVLLIVSGTDLRIVKNLNLSFGLISKLSNEMRNFKLL